MPGCLSSGRRFADVKHLPSTFRAPGSTFPIAPDSGRWFACRQCGQPRFIPNNPHRRGQNRSRQNDFRATSVFTEGVKRASCERSAGVWLAPSELFSAR